jgi:hypothetical protein
MTSVVAQDPRVKPVRSTSARANVLAARLEHGARALAVFADGLTQAEWDTAVPHDGRTVGVVVHHVASVYPIEIQLAQTVAAGQPITGVTMDDIHVINARHARDHAGVTKEAALDLLRRHSAAAAEAIRALRDQDLEQAATVSLYAEAVLTCQFVLEDHAVRHSFHHLARVRAALNR